MNEFDTLEKVKKLFEEKNCIDNNSIYIALYQDSRKYSGMVDGMEYPYDGMLLNISDNGIGYFYLKLKSGALKAALLGTKTYDKLEINKESYNFISNEEIISIELKKFALLDKKRKLLTIKTKDGKKHYLYGFIDDPTLSYHNENMNKLIQKFEK